MRKARECHAEELLARLRERQPLVHNITNYVAMNFTANALLSLGASPVMAHAVEEAEDMAALAGALVLNIGTLSTPWINAMLKAGAAAGRKGIPIVLDPVGAGATKYRTNTARRILQTCRPNVVRGNASEILALAGAVSRTRGVDSQDDTLAAREVALDLARRAGVVIAMTGVVDFVTDGRRTALISNGHPLMGRVTATGCAASAITGAFCAVEPDAWRASVGALAAFGVAGEIASEGGPGPGTFQARILDALNALTPALLKKRARIETSTAAA
jgi:hydroxyethylthiazole kinase